MTKIRNAKRPIKRKPRAMRASGGGASSFGAVSTINTAPVAIGNSISGFKSRVTSTPGGVRIIGRDYGFTPQGTGTSTTWAVAGGIPLTPACMPTTILRNFVHMYSKFKIHSITFHYITSSATSSTGDIVFYNQTSAPSSMINWTASSFLPFVLSEPENVIGPQWTNHSMVVRPKGGWKHCNPFLNADQDDDSYGDIYLLTKTATTDSPGYVIMDYDISFTELEFNPRSAFVPLAAAQWAPFDLTWSEARTIYDTGANSLSGTVGVGATAITQFTATASGDIYKVFIDVTNSTFTSGTAANLWVTQLFTAVYKTLNLTDGFTVYARAFSTTRFEFYASLESALSSSNPLLAGATLTYDVELRGYAKYVASMDATALQYSV